MITDFLTKEVPPDEMRAALRVIRIFKECESDEEWFGIPFAAWAKLEQLIEFLEHRIEGKPLAEDTLEFIKETSAA